MDIREIGIPADAVGERLRALLARDADRGRKLLLAKAAIPLPPEQLIPALAILTNDPTPEVRQQAVETLSDLPAGTVGPYLSSGSAVPGVLDRLARVLINTEPYIERLVINRATPDQTLCFLARHGQGRMLEIIAQNQVRLAAHPAIIEALYFNPKARMSTISQALEYAVREGLPLKSMPGYREIVASLVGDLNISGPELGEGAGGEGEVEAPAEAPLPAGPQEDPDEEPLPPAAAQTPQQSPEELLDGFLDQQEREEDEEEGWGDFSGESTSPGLEEDADEAFFAVLAAAMLEEGGEGDGDEDPAIFIADQIRNMGVSERVRLALMGNATAREILVRDANRLVATAVLRNSGLGDREVLTFAGNRSISAEVLRIIAASREWTRDYQIKLALVQNPKTPTAFAVQYLRHLRERELKSLAKNRDVPPVIARLAKRMVDEKAAKGKPE